MHRFFLLSTPLRVRSQVDLSPLVHQLQGVLRLQVGEQIVLLDNRGAEFLTEITAIERKRASGRILAMSTCQAEPTMHLTLYQCTLKADKFEWVLQKCTELGVSRFVPVISERSVVRPAAALLSKYERWQAIVREAAEQCGRGRIPELVAPMDWRQAVSMATGVRLVAWEESGRLANQGEKGAGETLKNVALRETGQQAFNLLIGSEGGITADEIALAVQAGWQCVSLGRRILRAETAAVAAVAVLMA